MIYGAAPTISIENTSGFQLYLSKDSIVSFITTAKSSKANVMVRAEDLDADMIRSLEKRTKVSKYANKFAWNSNAHLVMDGVYRV
nr:cyclase-associated protein 1-like [Tanacetum cinerariifolium]